MFHLHSLCYFSTDESDHAADDEDTNDTAVDVTGLSVDGEEEEEEANEKEGTNGDCETRYLI